MSLTDKEPRPKTAAEVAEMNLREVAENRRAASEPINWILGIFLELSEPHEVVPALRSALTKEQLRGVMEAEGLVAKGEIEKRYAEACGHIAEQRQKLEEMESEVKRGFQGGGG